MAPVPGPRLIVFDVDGTLVDSQAAIVGAMSQAFARAGRPAPARSAALGVVGLSLPQAMAVLAPEAGTDEHLRLVGNYREAFAAFRRSTGGEATMPLYPGALETVARLHAAGYLLGIATGKARRGLDHFLATHGIGHRFVATRTADDAPSKPHPQMLLGCIAAAGVEPRDAVMVGDTEFDMAMAVAAGCRAIGVSWGYHPAGRVLASGAERIADSFDELGSMLEALWEPA